jgi:hypothetical protein
MTETLHLHVLPAQEDAVVVTDGIVVVQTFRRKLRLSNLDDATCQAFKQLLIEHASLYDVVDELAEKSPTSLQHVYSLLQRMYQDGSVRLEYHQDGVAMGQFIAMHPMPLILGNKPHHAAMHMSRFAILHRGAAHVTLEAPLALARLEILHPALATDITTRLTATGDHPCNSILDQVLISTGLAFGINADGTSAERSIPELESWGLHEAYFQFRSRYGYTSYPNGAYWLAAGHRQPPSAQRPVDPDATTIALPKPADISSQPLEQVITNRVSTKSFQARALTLDEIGTLLWRTMRQTGQQTMQLPGIVGQSIAFELKRRPVPSGGSIHELDAYLLTTLDGDLSPGLWRYDDVHHTMVRVADVTEDAAMICARAQVSAGLPFPPHTVLLFPISR